MHICISSSHKKLNRLVQTIMINTFRRQINSKLSWDSVRLYRRYRTGDCRAANMAGRIFYPLTVC